MPRWVRRTLLVTLGSTLGVGLGEVAVRLAGFGEKGSLAVLYESDPELGWRHKPGAVFEHQTPEFSITWRMERHGIRRDADVDPEADGFRLAVLGDSHTAGHGVEIEETYAALLEKRLRAGKTSTNSSEAQPPEVLNFGVDGYATCQELLWLEHRARSWRPDGVVVGVYLGNDLRENFDANGLSDFRRPLLDHKLQPVPVSSEDLASATDSSDRSVLQVTKDFLSDHSRLYATVGSALRDTTANEVLARFGLMRPPRHRTSRESIRLCQGGHGQLLWCLYFFQDQPQRESRALRRLADQLERMQQRCQELGSRFLAVLLPARLQVEGELAEVREAAAFLGLPEDPRPIIERLHREVVAALEQRGISYLDALPLAQAERQAHPDEKLYYPLDWHLNARGHAFLADIIEKEIRRRDWLAAPAGR